MNRIIIIIFLFFSSFNYFLFLDKVKR